MDKLKRKKIGRSHIVPTGLHKKILLSDWNSQLSTTLRRTSMCSYAPSRIIFVSYEDGRVREENVQFDKRESFSSPSGCNFGIRICCMLVRGHVYDVKVNHRLQFGIVVTALQCNQHCEKISGSQRESLIKIAVIIVRLQLWFCGFLNICPREEEPIWMKIDAQYGSVSSPGETLYVHVDAAASLHAYPNKKQPRSPKQRRLNPCTFSGFFVYLNTPHTDQMDIVAIVSAESLSLTNYVVIVLRKLLKRSKETPVTSTQKLSMQNHISFTSSKTMLFGNVRKYNFS